MRVIFVIFLLVVFSSAEDFITKMEYAKMLYFNPRGIGCNLCHGKNANGSVIARYKSRKGKKETLKAPAISNLDFDDFKNALGKTHKVMPTYFLTDKEIKILYFYVKSQAKKR
jgi:mono/diheme cytochrome c family protein